MLWTLIKAAIVFYGVMSMLSDAAIVVLLIAWIVHVVGG